MRELSLKYGWKAECSGSQPPTDLEDRKMEMGVKGKGEERWDRGGRSRVVFRGGDELCCNARL